MLFLPREEGQGLVEYALIQAYYSHAQLMGKNSSDMHVRPAVISS